MSQVSQDRYRKIIADKRRLPVAEARPYLIPMMLKLGAHPDYAQKATVGKAYNMIHGAIREALGKPKTTPVGNYYTLWTKGVPLDHLKTITRKQAREMVRLLDAANIKQEHGR